MVVWAAPAGRMHDAPDDQRHDYETTLVMPSDCAGEEEGAFGGCFSPVPTRYQPGRTRSNVSKSSDQ